jgi:hypothetical protein
MSTLPPGTATVLFGDGTGSFASPVTQAVPSTVSGPYGYADCSDVRPVAITFSPMSTFGLGDVDGDGRADLMLADFVFLSTGRGLGAASRIEGAGTASAGSSSGGPAGGFISLQGEGPQLTDLDGDGKLEEVDVGIDGFGTSPTGSVRVGRANPPGVHTW